jgi:GntR family transcriptional regulator
MPKWSDLAALIEAQITSGELKPGDLLPSEADLAREHQLARSTVRQALGYLENRGLVRGAGGARRQVADPRVLLQVHVTRPASRVANHQSPTPGADSWAHDVADLGHVPGVRLWVRSHEAGELARRLGLSMATPVITREQLRLVDGKPHNLVTWTFPRALARGTKLAYPEDIPEGSIPYLSGIGQSPDTITVEIETRMPDHAETGVLEIPPGVPLLVEHRTGLHAGGVVFVSVTRWPGDRARLILEM